MTNDNDSVRADAGFDRRGLIKRAAVVGVATAWATPTIQSLAAPAFAVGTKPCTARLTGGGEVTKAPKGNSPSSDITGTTVSGKQIEMISFGIGQLLCLQPGQDVKFAEPELSFTVHSKQKGEGAESFMFKQLISLVCSKTGNPAPGPNTADCANRFDGKVTDGRGNYLKFVFEDFGEPGQKVDRVELMLTTATNRIVTASGSLSKGNLQAHDNIPTLTRDCTGC